MLLGRVIRSIVATHKDVSLVGRKLHLIQETDPHGEPRGQTFVAVEKEGIGAGPGDLVLIHREGSGARQMLDDPGAPVNAMVCGIVDQIHMQDMPIARTVH